MVKKLLSIIILLFGLSVSAATHSALYKFEFTSSRQQSHVVWGPVTSGQVLFDITIDAPIGSGFPSQVTPTFADFVVNSSSDPTVAKIIELNLLDTTVSGSNRDWSLDTSQSNIYNFRFTDSCFLAICGNIDSGFGSISSATYTSVLSSGSIATVNLGILQFIALVGSSGRDRFSFHSTGGLDGDFTYRELAAIPVPAAAWLFGTALIGLVGFSKRGKAT